MISHSNVLAVIDSAITAMIGEEEKRIEIEIVESFDYVSRHYTCLCTSDVHYYL